MTAPEILALPACLEIAERLAEALWAEMHLTPPDGADFRALVTAFARLIADLDRPASRFEWSEWLWTNHRETLHPWLGCVTYRADPVVLRSAILEVTRA